MTNLELLAPAGDLQSFKCAIYNGADAVYLGLNNFNARIKAENFTKDNISEIVKFAHIYNVKVYVTINTLIKDDEVEDFLDVVRYCINAKVDAFIIQDLGMAMLLKSKFNGIVLHASTQMGIHNYQGAYNLQKLGFSRVVLSRETKLEDIRLIRERTNLEIEYFVQGALCVAFSGNCYMSALKNGNSGNRGKCLQLCRLPYKIFKGEKLAGQGYYLSSRDLNLMSQLENLIDAGVTSLKIEGRLKRASYVTQVVRSYRKLLCSIENKSKFDKVKEQEKIKEIFSRGEFNESAYLYDNFDIINTLVNNHEGKKIGKVTSVAKFKDIYKITLSLTHNISEGDAIRLIGESKTISIGVGNVNVLKNGFYEVFSTQNPQINSNVYLLKNEQKEQNLTQFERKLPITLNFCAKEGRKATLVAKYNTITVEVQSEDVVQKAKSKPLLFEDVYKQVCKLLDTKFRLDNLFCDMDDVFVPVSILNDLRRRVVIELEDKIIEIYNYLLPNIIENEIDINKPQIKTQAENFIIIKDVRDWDKNIKNSVIIAPDNYGLEHLIKMIEQLSKLKLEKSQIYINLPIVSTSVEQEKIERVLSKLNIGIVINNYSQLHLISKYDSIAGIGMNIYNSYTAKEYIKMGCKNYIYSLELYQYSKGSGIVYSKGYPVLMTLCHCPIRVINGGDCGNCKYCDDLVYEDDKYNRYSIRRMKLDHCYFELCSHEQYERISGDSKIIDMRKI